MIAADQPTVFPDSCAVSVSSKDDGTMLDKTGSTSPVSITRNRTVFCHQTGINFASTVYQTVLYQDDSKYNLLAEVDSRGTTKFNPYIVADGLYTEQVGVGLFLPVADCIATVIYDPSRGALALLHMGRHSTFSDLIPKILNHFVTQGSSIKNLVIWMGPSVQRISYKLDHFSFEHDATWQPFFDKKTDGYYLDMQGYNRQKCIAAGVSSEQITISAVDTVTNDNYFSHSAGDTTQRFAVLAMMR